MNPKRLTDDNDDDDDEDIGTYTVLRACSSREGDMMLMKQICKSEGGRGERGHRKVTGNE